MPKLGNPKSERGPSQNVQQTSLPASFWGTRLPNLPTFINKKGCQLGAQDRQGPSFGFLCHSTHSTSYNTDTPSLLILSKEKGHGAHRGKDNQGGWQSSLMRCVQAPASMRMKISRQVQ